MNNSCSLLRAAHCVLQACCPRQPPLALPGLRRLNYPLSAPLLAANGPLSPQGTKPQRVASGLPVRLAP
eukprot:15097775-Alexandrium_andersonii.AAC.1